MLLTKTYYNIKYFLPRRFQLFLRRGRTFGMMTSYEYVWPIFEQASKKPENWKGWPDGKKFALVLTHDVETDFGQGKCENLVNIEEKLGFKSSFYFVPERYKVSPELRKLIQGKGFEVGCHGLNHDGKLYKNLHTFQERAKKINGYMEEWGACGFRSPSMHHNLEWLQQLDIKYDASTNDTDPFEPQCGGVGTIFPFIIHLDPDKKSYVEMPYTLPQDFTLFIIMKEANVETWKKKLDWIAEHGGMALINTHPDYMNFKKNPKFDEYPVEYYEEFLNYVKTKYEGQFWNGLPSEVADFCNENKDNVNTFEKYKWFGEEELLCDTCLKIASNKRRICMLAYTFYETDNRVLRYAEALAKRGDYVEVVSLCQGEQPFYEVINGVHVYRIQRRVIDEKRKRGYLKKLLKFLVKSSIFITRRNWRQKYDLIHVHSVPDFEVFAALLPKLTGTKLILDIHDIVPEFYASKFNASKKSILFKLLALVEKISCMFSNHVIISNDLWQKTVVKRSVQDEKCSVFLNYPDQNIFKVKKNSRNDGKFVMSYPGTLSWHQGLDLAVKAMSIIKDKAPNAEFHIYGDGTERVPLIELTEKLGLQDRVLFKGFLPMREIAKVMSNVDLGVVPKRTDSFSNEAFSTKIFEFMMVGVPVLAANTAIDRFYFNDSVIKFFNAGDENDLAEKMLELINSREKLKTLSSNATELLKEYNWEIHRERYYNLVDSLIGKNDK